MYDRRYLLNKYSLKTLILKVIKLENCSISSTIKKFNVVKAFNLSKKIRRFALINLSLLALAFNLSFTFILVFVLIATIYNI